MNRVKFADLCAMSGSSLSEAQIIKLMEMILLGDEPHLNSVVHLMSRGFLNVSDDKAQVIHRKLLAIKEKSNAEDKKKVDDIICKIIPDKYKK